MPRKGRMVLVSIWCQSKITSSPQPSSPTNARWLRSNPQLSLDSSSWQFTLMPNLQQQSRGNYQNQSFPDQPQTLRTKEEARQEVNSMTVLTSNNSLVDLENFNSLVKLFQLTSEEPCVFAK